MGTLLSVYASNKLPTQNPVYVSHANSEIGNSSLFHKIFRFLLEPSDKAILSKHEVDKYKQSIDSVYEFAKRLQSRAPQIESKLRKLQELRNFPPRQEKEDWPSYLSKMFVHLLSAHEPRNLKENGPFKLAEILSVLIDIYDICQDENDIEGDEVLARNALLDLYSLCEKYKCWNKVKRIPLTPNAGTYISKLRWSGRLWSFISNAFSRPQAQLTAHAKTALPVNPPAPKEIEYLTHSHEYNHIRNEIVSFAVESAGLNPEDSAELRKSIRAELRPYEQAGRADEALQILNCLVFEGRQNLKHLKDHDPLRKRLEKRLEPVSQGLTDLQRMHFDKRYTAEPKPIQTKLPQQAIQTTSIAPRPPKESETFIGDSLGVTGYGQQPSARPSATPPSVITAKDKDTLSSDPGLPKQDENWADVAFDHTPFYPSPSEEAPHYRITTAERDLSFEESIPTMDLDYLHEIDSPSTPETTYNTLPTSRSSLSITTDLNQRYRDLRVIRTFDSTNIKPTQQPIAPTKQSTSSHRLHTGKIRTPKSMHTGKVETPKNSLVSPFTSPTVKRLGDFERLKDLPFQFDN